jgi:hypothetical protein
VIVPLLDETIELLNAIKIHQLDRWQQLAETRARKNRLVPPRPVTVLTNTRCQPWTADGADTRSSTPSSELASKSTSAIAEEPLPRAFIKPAPAALR